MNSESMAAYIACREFLATEAAISLRNQIEKETGEPAVKEEGLDIWVHPKLAQLMALWMDSPGLIQWTNKNLPPFI